MKARGILLLIVLILAMIQDQALVASKHYLVETEGKLEDGIALGTLINILKYF